MFVVSRVAAGPGYITLHVHGGRIRGIWIFVNQHAIARLELDVFVRVAGDRLREIHAKDFEFAVRQVSEHLRVFALRVRAQAAGQLNRIHEANLAGSPIGSRAPDIAPDGNAGRIFEIELAVDANRIHRLQQGRVGRIGERVSEIEAFD